MSVMNRNLSAGHTTTIDAMVRMEHIWQMNRSCTLHMHTVDIQILQAETAIMDQLNYCF